MWPRRRSSATVNSGTRLSTTKTPGRAARGQNEDGKCSVCQAGASIEFLKIQPRVNVPEEKLRDPLILLVAAWCSPGEVGFAIAQRHCGRQRRARALAGSKARRVALLEHKHLRARAEAEAERRNCRGRLQPAAGRGRGDHVAEAVDDVEMHRVATGLAEDFQRSVHPSRLNRRPRGPPPLCAPPAPFRSPE